MPLCFVSRHDRERGAANPGFYRSKLCKDFVGYETGHLNEAAFVECDLSFITNWCQLTEFLIPPGSTLLAHCTRREPFISTPMGVDSISFGPPHVHPTGRTCGEPNEIKKNTHPENVTALFLEQAPAPLWRLSSNPRRLCSRRTRPRWA